MDTTAIKQEIDDNIKPNGAGAITGKVLNETLNDIVDKTTPEFYSEDGDTNGVYINTDYEVDIHGVEKVELSTAGWHLKLSEEEGVRLGNSEVSIGIQRIGGVTINDESVLTSSDLSFFSRVLGVDNFRSNIQYSIGDLVLYQNILYQFKNNHLGAWNFSDVQETNLRELLNF